MIVFATLCLGLAVLALFRADGVWKKILASNIVVSLLVMVIVLVALETGISYYLDIAYAFALLSFIGTQFFARFLRGKEAAK